MLAEIEKKNARSDLKNPVIRSTDVVNMYPSLPIDEIAIIVTNEFLRSDLTIETDRDELGLYLAIQLSPKKIKGHGLSDVVHQVSPCDIYFCSESQMPHKTLLTSVSPS